MSSYIFILYIILCCCCCSITEHRSFVTQNIVVSPPQLIIFSVLLHPPPSLHRGEMVSNIFYNGLFPTGRSSLENIVTRAIPSADNDHKLVFFLLQCICVSMCIAQKLKKKVTFIVNLKLNILSLSMCACKDQDVQMQERDTHERQR